MEKTTIGFPVPSRMKDINELVLTLKDAGLIGDWRFVRGSRYDQEWIEVEFDHPDDGPIAKRRHDRVFRHNRESAIQYPH